MAWSAGQILILLLALLVGLAAGWLLRGRFPDGAADPRSVTRSDLPAPADPVAPVSVEDTAVIEPRDAAVAVPVGEPPVVADQATVELDVHPTAGPEPVADTQPVRTDAPAPTQPIEPELPATEPVEPVASVTPVETADSAPTDTIGQAVEDAPAQEALVEQAPTEVAPVEDAPVEETRFAAAPVDDVPVEQAPIAAAPIEDVPVVAAPVQAAPVTTVADDNLRRIAGIGPKIEVALQAAGFRTYRQLAEATEPELRTAVRAANLRSAPGLANWAQQAQVLAEGGSPAAGGDQPAIV